MRFEDARHWLIERSQAVAGLEPVEEPEHRLVIVHESPDQMARKLLSGLVEGDELEHVLDGIEAITRNTLLTCAHCESPEQAFSGVFGLMTQQLCFGLLLGRDEVPS